MENISNFDIDYVMSNGDIINGEWRDTQQLWQPIARQGSNRPPDDAKAIHEILVEYYNSKDGEVPWQYSFI